MFFKEARKKLRETGVTPARKPEQNYRFEYWQNHSVLSSEDIRHITAAFYEYVCAEALRKITAGNEKTYAAQAEQFIQLLLPLDELDAANRIRMTFCRQDMLARVSYIFYKIDEMMAKEAGDDVASPLDSIRIFMQYLNNHLLDGNWQKIASAQNNNQQAIQQKLLALEYAQCQYAPGDPDYLNYEEKYRICSEQIHTDYRIAGDKMGLSPWSIRNLLKHSIKTVPRKEKKHWSWEKYTQLKGKTNEF